MRYWLQDPDCFDHYSVIYEGGEKTAIYQNTVHLGSVRDPTMVEERAVSRNQTTLSSVLSIFHVDLIVVSR